MDYTKSPFLKQGLIYSIETYKFEEYETEKIIFHYENIQKIHEFYGSRPRVKIIGMYGDQDAIENQVIQIYPNSDSKIIEKSSNDQKGRIIALYNEQVLIFCLIIPQKILQQKPLNERQIEITLVRIQQDLTQSIFTCFSKQVLENWYLGEHIPFHDSNASSLAEFTIEQIVQEKIQYNYIKLDALISDSHDGWSILNNTNNFPCFLMFRKIELSCKELNEFNNSLNNLMIEIIMDLFKSQKCELQNNLNKHLQQIYQTTQVILKIVEFNEKIKLEIEKLRIQIIEQIAEFFSKCYDDFTLQNCFNYLIDQLKYQDGKFCLSIPLNNLSKDYKQAQKLSFIEKEFIQEINKIKSKYVQNYSETITKEMQQQQTQKGNLILQKCMFSIIRERETNTIQKLTLVTQQKFLLDSTKLQSSQSNQNQNQIEEIKPISYFRTQKNSDILIVKKGYSYVVLQIINNVEYKKITNFENLFNPCFLYIAQMETLYCFNFKVSVAKIRINNLGKCTGDQVFWNVQNNKLIEDIAYLSFNQSFIGIDCQGNIIKWRETQNQFESIKALQIDPTTMAGQESDFRPSKNPKTKYKQIQSCPHGNFFFLSNLFVIDIYDFNQQLVQCIEFQAVVSTLFHYKERQSDNLWLPLFILQSNTKTQIFLKFTFKLFSDLFDAFILDIGNPFQKQQLHEQKVVVIQNLSIKISRTQIGQQIEQRKNEGNPIFDLIKGSQEKYGPTSQFLSQKRNKIINMYLLNTRIYDEKIKNYLEIRDLTNTCLFHFLDTQQCLEIINREEQDLESVLRITYSRVPTQFCTIENNQIIPLINGCRIQLNQNQSLAVPQKAKLLTLGYIEDYLNKLKNKIFVVSIIGRQSSGKSYLLNRLFGTQFSVAESRCTDGIWASISQINGKEFLVLDCEGLFSRQRTQEEETQLLAFLTGISDITILNQDLSFNRYLDEILDNLTNVIGKLKGETLFKGQLLIALRDVNYKDSSGAQEYILQRILDLSTKGKNSKSSNFMTTLFNDSFSVYQFQNFNHQNFSRTVDQLRTKFQQFIEEREHWKNGKILIETIKILLIQLETKDDSNISALINRCKFFCPICQDKKQFCQKPACHSYSNKYEDHNFSCRESHNNSEMIGYDIVFVIDATGSMGSYIEQSKQMIKKIMEKVKNTKCKDINFGIVAYRDHPPEELSFVTKVQELGTGEQALKFLTELTAEGGGDYPEAVLDGLQAAVDFKWLAGRDKMLFLIGDAPPHGKQYSDQSRNWADGCPCKISEKNLFRKMSSLSIQFKILNLNSGLNKMIEVFKSFISLEVINKELNFSFVDQVVGKVCEQIQMREITFRKQ